MALEDLALLAFRSHSEVRAHTACFDEVSGAPRLCSPEPKIRYYSATHKLSGLHGAQDIKPRAGHPQSLCNARWPCLRGTLCTLAALLSLGCQSPWAMPSVKACCLPGVTKLLCLLVSVRSQYSQFLCGNLPVDPFLLPFIST